MSTELGKQVERMFRNSWMRREMPSTGHISRRGHQVLDAEVRKRQATICKANSLVKPAASPPYSVSTLVHDIGRAITQIEEGNAHREAVDISRCCALVAELIASAMCPAEKLAGTIYPKPSTHDEDWNRVHRPLRLLRNAVFHPGSVVPWEKGESEAMTHVGALSTFMQRDRGSRYAERAARVLVDPPKVSDMIVAAWALEKLDAMGSYELSRLHNRF